MDEEPEGDAPEDGATRATGMTYEVIGTVSEQMADCPKWIKEIVQVN